MRNRFYSVFLTLAMLLFLENDAFAVNYIARICAEYITTYRDAAEDAQYDCDPIGGMDVECLLNDDYFRDNDPDNDPKPARGTWMSWKNWSGSVVWEGYT